MPETFNRLCLKSLIPAYNMFKYFLTVGSNAERGNYKDSELKLLFHDISQLLSIDYRLAFFALGRLFLSPGLGFWVRIVALAAGFLV